MADLNTLYAADYDSTQTYSAGDRCVNNKEWYEANAETTGEFDPDKWDKKYLVDYLNSNLGNNVSKVEDIWQHPGIGLNISKTFTIPKDGKMSSTLYCNNLGVNLTVKQNGNVIHSMVNSAINVGVDSSIIVSVKKNDTITIAGTMTNNNVFVGVWVY